MSNVQHKIAKNLFDVFSFIEESAENELMLREILRGIGWDLDELAGFSVGQLSDSLKPLAQDLKKLSEYVETPPETFSDIGDVLLLSEKLFNHIHSLTEVLRNIEFDSPDKDRLVEFVEDVLNYTVVLSISSRFPVVYDFLVLLTLIRGTERLEPITDTSGKIIRHPVIIPVLKPGRVSDLIKNPVDLLREEYFPNGLKTDHDAIIAANKLFPRIARIMEHFGVNTVFGFNKEHGIDFGEHGNILNAGMLTAFSEIEVDGQDTDLAVTLSLSPESRGDLGLVVIPSGNFNFSETFGRFLFHVKLTAGVDGFAIGREDVTILADTNTTSLEASFEIQQNPAIKNAPGFVLGSTGGSRLETGSLSASSYLNFRDEVFTFDLFAQAEKSKIVISPQDGDGFINSILPPDGLQLDFDFGLGWSNQTGLYFKGSAGMEAVYPIHKKILNTLVVEQLYLRLLAKDSSLRLETLLDFSVEIGPVKAQINTIGIQSALSDLGETGNVGFGNLSLGFAAPKGIGLKVNSDIITGGGFLEFDPDNHRYAGVLALKLALEKRDIGLTAIGLIDTRLPNGEKGFSMLVSISVFFSPVIPLAFGFTLNAVGGLVGIYRTIKVDILRERIQNGAVKSIMFPENVIQNAPKIISDLRAVFPPQKKHYVVAPFFKIGYGTPTVMEVDLGILLEFPFKGRIILLGSLGVYLPNKETEKRLGEIHVDIFGDFYFAASYILIEGRLRDSNLVEVALTGGFAFMLDWGNNPQFLLSVGGYHPRYKKPARFLEIPRVTALIKRGEDIRLSCQYYQAITSNSYQIGLTAELVVKKGKAKAYGFLGFNALLQFDPFYFETDIRISVEVSYRGRSFFGIEMEFMLSGPEPWRAQGFAKIKVLFFSLKIKFNISWGEKQKVAPIIVKPDVLLEKLKLQLEQSGNWTAKIPAGYTGAESLRSPDETGQPDQLLMHPSGVLELRQNLVPLNKTIEKLGNSYMEAGTSYRITDYAFGTGQPIQIQNKQQIQDYFSLGQFEDLPDSEKLSTPDFDLMSAGIEIAPEQVYDIPTDMQFTGNDFEDIILEETENIRSENPGNWQGERMLNLTGSRKPADVTRTEELFGMVEDVPVQKEKAYKILSKEALESPEELKAQYFNSYSGAKDFLKAQWPEDEQKKWQILQAEIEENELVVM